MRLLLIIIVGILSTTLNAQVDNQTKNKMFCLAMSCKSTAPYYVVVTVKNKKTGEVKEICTESNFIKGALFREKGNDSIDCNKNKTRYFEFSVDSALLNIDFNLYTAEQLANYAKTVNVKDIIQRVKSGKLTSMTFKFSATSIEQIMFAHLMFNNGVLVTRGCYAGNICGLSYFVNK